MSRFTYFFLCCWRRPWLTLMVCMVWALAGSAYYLMTKKVYKVELTTELYQPGPEYGNMAVSLSLGLGGERSPLLSKIIAVATSADHIAKFFTQNPAFMDYYNKGGDSYLAALSFKRKLVIKEASPPLVTFIFTSTNKKVGEIGLAYILYLNALTRKTMLKENKRKIGIIKSELALNSHLSATSVLYQQLEQAISAKVRARIKEDYPLGIINKPINEQYLMPVWPSKKIILAIIMICLILSLAFLFEVLKVGR